MKSISALFQFKTLNTKITIIFLLLILIIQATSYFTTCYNIEINARLATAEQLSVGEHIVNNLLAQNSKNLTQAAKILAADYGFREAVSSKDTETIVSALENYRGRIGATIALFHDASGQYLTGTANEDRHDADKSIALLIKNAEGQGSATGIVVMDNVPYQLVILPVKAPLLVGWVTMGFAVDDELANSVHALSALDVTFLIKTADGKLIPVATTLDKSDAAHLSQISQDTLTNGLTSTEIKLNKTLYSTRYVKFSEQGIGNENIAIALQSSLNEALAPYKTLQFNLLFIAILGSLIFIAVGIYIAQRITKPLDAFAKIAEKYGHGDYSTPAKVKGKDELARLGTALNNMRDAIANREKKITKLAYQDELTGLPNRAALTEIAEKHTKHMSSELRGITVILLDIDRFKEINTVLGKIDADEVLKIVAECIKAACYKNTGVVARYSWDKFAILLPKVTADIALSTAERILKSLELPSIVNEHSVDLAARMGVATYPNHANTIEALFGSAELAMHEAKRLQTNAVIYSSKLDVSKEQSLSFSTEIKEALEQNQFKFYVQPKLNLRTNKIVAVEALIRWLNPQQELLSPDKFIPQAEKAGHIAKISLWMLINAATHYAKWQSYGINISIAVNLSARDLMDVDLPDKIAKIMSDRHIPPKAIALEITESSIMEDPEQARITVARLSNMGLKISIDDFGTGYSSFAYLKNLQVDELKIDKSFIINMTPDSEDIKIVRSTIDLAHNMGLSVVAEGIETEAALDLLKELNCDFGQGYLIGRPMPVEKFNDWLIDWEAKDA